MSSSSSFRVTDKTQHTEASAKLEWNSFARLNPKNDVCTPYGVQNPDMPCRIRPLNIIESVLLQVYLLTMRFMVDIDMRELLSMLRLTEIPAYIMKTTSQVAPLSAHNDNLLRQAAILYDNNVDIVISASAQSSFQMDFNIHSDFAISANGNPKQHPHQARLANRGTPWETTIGCMSLYSSANYEMVTAAHIHNEISEDRRMSRDSSPSRGQHSYMATRAASGFYVIRETVPERLQNIISQLSTNEKRNAFAQACGKPSLDLIDRITNDKKFYNQFVKFREGVLTLEYPDDLKTFIDKLNDFGLATNAKAYLIDAPPQTMHTDVYSIECRTGVDYSRLREILARAIRTVEATKSISSSPRISNSNSRNPSPASRDGGLPPSPLRIPPRVPSLQPSSVRRVLTFGDDLTTTMSHSPIGTPPRNSGGNTPLRGSGNTTPTRYN